MSEPTPQQLDGLLALQGTDSSIRRLRHQLDELDEQRRLDEAQAQLDAHAAAHDDVVVALERARAEQRQLEREVDVLTERRDAEQARLYDGTVTNAREMRSVEAEIETTVRRISEHEELLIEVLEQVERLEADDTRLRQALDETRSIIAELTATRDDAAASILADLAEREVERDRQASELPAALLERYQAVAARTGGVAAGRLEGQSCSACRVELSMADVGELRSGPALATCPQCRRLLVVD